MRITLKLYANLGDLLPAHAKANTALINVPEDVTPYQVIDAHNVPREQAHLVLLNGVFIPAEERDKPIIKADDSLAIWPPVAGG